MSTSDASAPKREPVEAGLRRAILNIRCDAYTKRPRGIHDALKAASACLDEIEDLLKDKVRLDWLDKNMRGCVKGTDTADWYIEAPDEDECTLREVIDAALRGEPKEGM